MKILSWSRKAFALIAFAGASSSPVMAQTEATALRAEINPGSPAPAFSVGRWLKGQPFDKLTKGKVYVVEFWATWCGPCRETMPHLTELSKKYYGKATFVGVSVWENDEAALEPFVKDMGEKVGYALVRDKVIDPKVSVHAGKMSTTWLEPAGVNGIPSTFIVNREGVIAWIGHPSKLEEPLQRILDGTWDIDAHKASYVAWRRGPLAQKNAYAAFEKQDWPNALKFADEGISFGFHDLQVIRYGALAKLGNKVEAEKLGKELLDLFKESWNMVEFLARMIVEPPFYSMEADLDLALSAAERAVSILDAWPTRTTLAHVYYIRGDKAMAIEMLEAALATIPEQEPNRKKFEQRLKEYRATASAEKT